MFVTKLLGKAILRPLLKITMRVIFGTKLKGLLPEKRPEKTLIVANHESFLDGLVLGALLPSSWNPVFVVHTWVAANPFFKIVLSAVDHVAVDPTNPMAMKTLAKVLDSGRPVVIFPEGRLTTTGSLMKVYEGPAFLAAKTGATVIPIRLSGTGRTYFTRLSSAHPKKWFPRIEAAVADSTNIVMPDLPRARDRRRKAGEMLREIMQGALFSTTRPKTLWGALSEASTVFGIGRGMVEDVSMREYTYGEVKRIAAALSSWVESKVEGEKRVGLFMPSAVPTLGLMFGLPARGITPCMLNYTAGPDSLIAAMRAAEISSVVSSKAFVLKGKLMPLIEAMEANGKKIIWADEAKNEIGLLDKAKAFYFSLFPSTFEKCSDPNSEAIVIFTSGSEGTPKGVVHTHTSVISNAAQVKAVMDVSAEDRFLCALPLFHSFGLTAGAILPLLSGSSLFLYPSPLHYRVIPEIAYDRNCTILFGTNTFLANYAKFADPYDFCRIRRVVAGAEKLQDSTRDVWNDKFGLRIFEGYGATETAPVLSVNTPNAFRRGSVGRFLPGVDYKLLPVPGVEKGGLLCVTGPNLMKGYLKADAPGVLVPPVCEVGDGWHNMGDIVEVDSDGFIFIKGRLKRFAKIAGEMVSLEVAEVIASNASPDFAHACSSKADKSKGEALVLFTTDANLTRDKLVASAASLGKPELAIAKDIRHVQAIPILGTGKTDYVALQKMVGA